MENSIVCVRVQYLTPPLFADLVSSDRESEHFLKKINRARFALARTDSVRSVSGSIFAKPPYRRATSMPLHLVTKTQPAKGMLSSHSLGYFVKFVFVLKCKQMIC